MIVSESMLNEFKMHLVYEEKSTVSIEKYLRDVKAFARFAAGREVTKEMVMRYKGHLQEKGYATASINSMLAAVNSFLKFSGLGRYCVKQLKMQREIYCPKEKELTKKEYQLRDHYSCGAI